MNQKKKEISKDVAAFANSNGGIIIYGLTEKDHKANSFSFVDGDIYSKEWLEQIISSTIQRNIEGLKIFPIRNNGNTKETIYVVQIPESFDAPHLSKDKKFYKRYNFESVAMEEYEIRNLYGKKSKPILTIESYVLKYVETKNNQVNFLCRVGISNDGDIEESNYKINTYFEEYLPSGFKIGWETHDTHKKYNLTKIADNRWKVSNIGDSAIYPNEVLNISHFNIYFSKNDILEAFDKMKISFTLLYSGGQDKFEIDFTSHKEYYMQQEKYLD
ncbi:AlbA family DNA-binding domain-containing protein [Flavobacterium tyrosinilyticum]|uniref:AlbA family DNA-binding domain-containing protein n=1 Tax=Flavobacterium tyrosinilyticum TaxID=1658740 RepID=UPI0020308BBC|nr:ATP-binding protein [Flavobacterium tyrosinilyticum]MCM0666220.1 ATP-binding protein [Flavobacterium tyrosinilyticum]